MQITLHTAVFYIKDHDRSTFFLLNFPRKHTQPRGYMVSFGTHFTIFKNHIPPSRHTIFFLRRTDIPLQEKKYFYLLSQIEIGFKHVTWSFFEAAHGKGAADGIGGAVKRTLDSTVAHGEDILDAKTAYEVLSDKGLIKMTQQTSWLSR